MSDLTIQDIDAILVPQGAEYKAIYRVLKAFKGKEKILLSIPIGTLALTFYLKQWQQNQRFRDRLPTRILLMGLCGSLSPKYKVGDIVIYQSCRLENQNFVEDRCDIDLTNLLCDRFEGKANLVKGLTCDRVIWSTQEKLSLHQTYQADVVDMESYSAIEILHHAGISVAILRIVSDDSRHDIPNLTPAINPEGSLKPLTLTRKMAQNPLAAIRLIRGSLKGLKVLQQVTHQLFSDLL